MIEKDAEQSHIEFYKNHTENNKLFWPREMDYFYGELIMSPDKKRFLSAGWIWGSQDCFMIFDIEQFIESNRVEPIMIDVWEHNGRDVCFIDNTKVAVLFNSSEDDVNFKGVDEGNVFYIRLYNTDGSREFETITLETELDLNGVQMFFNIERQNFYLFSEKIGLLVVSLSGDLELHQKNIFINNYYNKYDCFIEYDKKKISVFKLDY